MCEHLDALLLRASCLCCAHEACRVFLCDVRPRFLFSFDVRLLTFLPYLLYLLSFASRALLALLSGRIFSVDHIEASTTLDEDVALRGISLHRCSYFHLMPLKK